MSSRRNWWWFYMFFLYFDKFTISASIAIFTSAVLPTLFPRPPTATIFLEEISFKKKLKEVFFFRNP